MKKWIAKYVDSFYFDKMNKLANFRNQKPSTEFEPE